MKNIIDSLVINESYKPKHRLDNNAAYDKWLEAAEMLGVEDAENNKMLSEIFNQFDTDAIVWFLENLDTDYELGLF